MSKQNKIIAVDFDGVLCKDEYPNIGEPNTEMIQEIAERKKSGDKIILWTCRRGIYLAQAVKWCKNKGLIFDAINKNLPESIEKYNGDTRKVFADIYIDDRFDYMAALTKSIELGTPVEYFMDNIDEEFYKIGFIKTKSEVSDETHYIRDVEVMYERFEPKGNYIHCIYIRALADGGFKVQSYQKDNDARNFSYMVSLSDELLKLINAKINKMRKKSNAESWSEREIKIFKEDIEEDCEYVSACCDSALKAYESLCEDGHSGYSIGITKTVLDNLIDMRPLTPIDDTDDIWNELIDFPTKDGVEKAYQCKRMSSLFKDVYSDGTVKYSDVDRVICVNINDNNDRYTMGFIRNIINEVYPITMPYTPTKTPFEVYTEEFLYDSNNGDFDTIGIFYVIKPDGKKITINRFFKVDQNTDDLKEISKFEYFIKKARKTK